MAWAVSLLPDLDDFFSSTGVVPRQPISRYELGVFEIWTGDRAIMVGWAVLMVAAFAMTLGWHSRLASLTVFVLILSFEYRCPYIFNSGDGLLRIEALLLALAPSGAALSLDQKRTSGSFWSAQDRARWPIRLMQVQFSLIYIATFVTRMTGQKWPEGTALSYAMRLEDMLIAPVPTWITTNATIMNVATWGTLVGELLIGILVWNRRCRSVVLIAGLVLHGTILITIAVGFFTPAMFLLYLAFVPPDTVRRWVLRAKDVVAQRLSPRRFEHDAGPERVEHDAVHPEPRQPAELAAE